MRDFKILMQRVQLLDKVGLSGNSRSRKLNDFFVPKKLGMLFSIPVTGNGLSKSGIRTEIEFERWEKEGL